MIHENGYSNEGKLEDYDRISYLHAYLSELRKAVSIDHCNVVAYSG